MQLRRQGRGRDNGKGPSSGFSEEVYSHPAVKAVQHASCIMFALRWHETV